MCRCRNGRGRVVARACARRSTTFVASKNSTGSWIDATARMNCYVGNLQPMPGAFPSGPPRKGPNWLSDVPIAIGTFGGRELIGDRATARIEDIWCEKIRGCSYREGNRLRSAFS